MERDPSDLSYTLHSATLACICGYIYLILPSPPSPPPSQDELQQQPNPPPQHNPLTYIHLPLLPFLIQLLPDPSYMIQISHTEDWEEIYMLLTSNLSFSLWVAFLMRLFYMEVDEGPFREGWRGCGRV
jgi:hypothetical protein